MKAMDRNFSLILDVLEDVVNEEDKKKVAIKLLNRITDKALFKNGSNEGFDSVLKKIMKMK